jgi:predicted transcriptional regulator
MGSVKDLRRRNIKTDDPVRWVISVDRRLLVMKAARQHKFLKASEISEETGRSLQNVSRALKELEKAGLVECLTPGKQSWRKYVLTRSGRNVLAGLKRYFS